MARLRQRLPVRWQLLLLVLALAAPFLVFLLISAERQSRHGRDEAGQQMLASARLTAARLDDHVGDILQVLAVLSHTVDPTPGRKDFNDALLHELAHDLPPQIHNISVWAADGSNAGSLVSSLDVARLNVSERDFFRQAMRGTGFAVEAPVMALTRKERVSQFAMGILREDRVVGVVTVAAQLSHLQTLLGSGAVPPSAVVTITSAEGMVLARSIDPEKWVGRNLRQQPGALSGGLMHHEGVRDAPSADGIWRIAGYTTSQRVPWQVYVGIPLDDALAPVRNRLMQNLVVGGVMFVLGLLLALWVAQRISRPLVELSHDAAMLEKGELQHRSRVAPGGEIGTLAATLNRMADALQQRTVLLQASEARLRHLAEFDGLTSLPNRALFLDRLETALARYRSAGAAMALLFLDIDHFKTVNDTLGHAAGDALLKAIALDLQGQVRTTDTVARLAGDEFTVLLESIGSAEDAARIAQQLVQHARRTVGSGDGAVAVSISVGLAMFQPGDTAATLLQRADDALYAAKHAGRDGFAAATPHPQEPAS